MSPNRVTLSQFQYMLSEVLGVPVAELRPECHFLDDLGIQSLRLVEMIFAFESQLGVRVPTEAAWEMETVGLAYETYIKLLENGHGPQ